MLETFGSVANTFHGGIDMQNYTTKVCTKCKQEKPLSEYYKDKRHKDGLYTHCKSCQQALIASWESRNAGKAKAYRKQWSESHKEHRRELARLRYHSNGDIVRARKIAHRDTIQGKAQTKLANAVHLGQIDKPHTCSECGCANMRIDGHHSDYSKPLDVEWLCTTCHNKRHRKAA